MTHGLTEQAKTLLGKDVVVTISDVEGEHVVTEGRLLAFSDGGDFEIMDDDGLVEHCWPMLKIQERKGEVVDRNPEQ